MRTSRVLLIVTFFAILLMSVRIPSTSAYGEDIYCPYSSDSPRIDGRWTTPVEWKDASETIMQNKYNWGGYLRTKHDNAYLFVLIDLIDLQYDEWPPWDQALVYFDTLANGGNLPQYDDYGIHAYWYNNVNYAHGVGTGWDAWTPPTDLVLKRGFSSQNDPYEPNRDHRTWEFRIPLKSLGKLGEPNFRMGFYIMVVTEDREWVSEWPQDAGGYFAPNSSYAIPPGPTSWGIIWGERSGQQQTTSQTSHGQTTAPQTVRETGHATTTTDGVALTVVVLLLVVVGVLAVVLLRRPKSSQTPQAITYCMICGAAMPVSSDYCGKCGARQG